MDNPDEPGLDPDFLRARREAWWILAIWLACMIWTLGYCGLRGYDVDAASLKLVFGMPSWIFWGVALPWFMATLVSIVFAARVMHDHPLDEVEGEGSTDDDA